MEVEELRWFVAVADGQTVGETADTFGVSQPAVTRGLQRLSGELGASVTERVGRRLRLTASGYSLLGRARRVIEEIDEARREVAEANDPDSGTVRLGFLSPLGTWLVPALLTAFRTERPRVRFELRDDGFARISQALLEGNLDLLLSSHPPVGEVRFEPLLEEELVLNVPEDHRLAVRQQVRIAQLADEEWVLQSSGYGLRQRVEELCAEAGFEPKAAFEGPDLSTLFALIASGSGIGLFPTRPAAPSGVRQVQLSPRVRRTIGLVSVPGAVRSPSADAFAELVRRRAGEFTGANTSSS